MQPNLVIYVKERMVCKHCRKRLSKVTFNDGDWYYISNTSEDDKCYHAPMKEFLEYNKLCNERVIGRRFKETICSLLE